MEKSTHTALPELTPFIISVLIHALLLLFIVSISYRYYYILSKREAAQEIRVDSLDISQDDEAESDLNNQNVDTKGGRGPSGLNDEAGRELWRCARSGISITPDNFLDYAEIRKLRKGLSVKPKKDIYKKYPFLTGVNQFDSGIGKKLKTDYRECYENVCRIINLPDNNSISPEDRPGEFTAAALDYLNGKRAVRSWRTLWMVRKPATKEDKIELARLLRRLHNYCIEGEDIGYEGMRGSLKSIIDIIPDELKFPARYK